MQKFMNGHLSSQIIQKRQGIDSSGGKIINGDFSNRYHNKNPFYAVSSDKFMRNHRQMIYTPEMNIEPGDCIKLIHDLRNSTLVLKTNDREKDDEFFFTNVAIGSMVNYQMAVTLDFFVLKISNCNWALSTKNANYSDIYCL